MAYVIQEVIFEESWLGIVLFNSTARTAKDLTQVNAQTDRDELTAALPTVANGGTCIECGIEEAVRVCMVPF